MTTTDHTAQSPQIQDPNVNTALNLQCHYFMSIGGELLIKQYATDSLASHPNFKPITQDEYEFLVSEMQS